MNMEGTEERHQKSHTLLVWLNSPQNKASKGIKLIRKSFNRLPKQASKFLKTDDKMQIFNTITFIMPNIQ